MSSSFTTGSLSISRQLTSSSKLFEKAATRLSSGKNINTASDNAAGLAIATALTAQAAIRDVGSQNASYAQSANDIASSAVRQISEISTRLSELAAQAANGSLSGAQRESLQSEYSQLRQEAERITQTTEFNGKQLLTDGSSTTTQIGPDGSSGSTVESGESSVGSIVSNIPSDISTQEAAQTSLDGLQEAQNQLSQQQGQIGATSSRLEYANNVNQTIRDSQIAAAARIQDADVPTEISNLSSAQLRSRAASFASTQLQESTKAIYSSLLGKIKA